MDSLPLEARFPLQRLLRTPEVANYLTLGLEITPMEVISIIYDMVELSATAQDNFQPFQWIITAYDEISQEFLVLNETGDGFALNLSTGSMGKRTGIILNDAEMNNSTQIYSSVIDAIERACPNLAGNVSLNTLPLPENNYLFTKPGIMEGSFSLLDNSDITFGFRFTQVSKDSEAYSVEIIDHSLYSDFEEFDNYIKEDQNTQEEQS